MSPLTKIVFVAVFVCLALVFVSANGEDEEQTVFKPSKKSVVARNLVSAKTTASAIVREHKKYHTKTGIKNFKGTTLAWVTPWNSKGYDNAKLFGCKLDYVSPTWYRVVFKSNKFTLEGKQDVDTKWVEAVKNPKNCDDESHDVQMVPRFSFDGFTPEAWSAAMTTQTAALVSLITDEIAAKNYDGFVLDAGYISFRQPTRPVIIKFINELGKVTHSKGKKFILVVPPLTAAQPEESHVNSADIVELQANVDLFSVMTYDFSNAQRPGFSSPPAWSLQSVMALVPRDDNAEEIGKKLLMGLNFYGNDFKLPSGGGPIVGGQYIDLLDKYKPKLVWEEEGAEHKFTYSEGGSSHVVFFPSLKFISDRLQSCERLTIGVAIWEIGQGLDFFFDLF